MTVYTLTTASPTSVDIIFAAETKSQMCVLGNVDGDQTAQAQVVLEVKEGAEYFDYRVTLPKNEPINYTLAANTYRLRLSQASDGLTYKVSVTPDS